MINGDMFQAHAGNYEQTVQPYLHIFGPSIATTNYMTASLSALLKSFGTKSCDSGQQVLRSGRTSLRDHHSHSPLRPSTAEVRTKHSRSGHSVE